MRIAWMDARSGSTAAVTVLALRQYNWLTSDAPAAAQATVILRGYKFGQYLSPYMSSLELEERLSLNGRWGVTLFAGAAKILRPGARLVTLDGVYVERQNPIAKILLKLDRGRHVRTADQYIALAQKHFEIVKSTILHDLMTIPYTHIILEAERPKIARRDQA